MHNNIIYVLFFYLLFALNVACASGIEIIPDENYIETTKKNIVTLTFNVRNLSDRRLEFKEIIKLPDHWKLLTTNPTFQLSPGDQRVQLVHIITNGSNSGEYPVSYKVEALKTPSISEAVEVIVNIKEVVGLKIETISIPQRVIFGKPFSAKVRIKNTGNVPLNYNIDTDDEFNYITHFSPKKIYLKSGQIEDVNIDFISSGKTTGILDYHFRVIVHAIEKNIEETLEEEISILSTDTDSVGSFYTLPGEITTSYIVEKGYYDNILAQSKSESLKRKQIEIKADGYIDKKKQKYLNILARTNKDSSVGEFANADLYSVNYNSPHIKLNIGYQSFRFNNLLNNYYSGIGINSLLKNKKWVVNYMSLKNREDAFEFRDDQSIRLERKIDRMSKISAGFFSRKKENGLERNYLGVDIVWQKDSLSSIFEYWRNKEAAAFYFKINDRIDEFHYQVSVSKQDDEFEGDQNYDYDYNVHASYDLNDKAQITYNARRKKNNPKTYQEPSIDDENFISSEEAFELSENISVASLDTRQNLSLAYTLDEEQAKRFTFDIEETKQEQERNAANSHTTYRFSSRYQQNFLNNTLKFDATLRKEKQYYGDNLSGLSARLNVFYKISDNLNLGFNVNSFSLPEKKMRYGAQGTYYFGWHRAKLTLAVNHEEYQERENTSDDYRINLDYPFRNGHKLSFGFNKRKAENPTAFDKRSNIYLSYTVPFGLPYKKRSIGEVRGRVYNEDSGEPVENAIIAINNVSAVSNAEGEFIYPGIDSGEQQILIDTSFSDEKNMIPKQGDNETILVKEGTVEVVEMPLYRGGELHGKVMQYGTQAKSVEELESMLGNNQLQATGGVADVLMTLVYKDNDNIVHKTITQTDGGFTFYRLMPGKWILKAESPKNNNSNEYLIKKKRRIVTIKKNKIEELEIQAIPKVLGIQNAGPSGGMSVKGN